MELELVESDKEGELENLFCSPRESIDETFSFRSIKWKKLCDTKTEVTFEFCFCDEVTFLSTVVVVGDVMEDMRGILFSIGMCVLPWFWMCFATPRIILEKGLKLFISSTMKEYWTTVYSKVLLEYSVLNRRSLSALVIEVEDYEANCYAMKTSEPTMTTTTNNRTLVPLGGGKDSIVAWHLVTEYEYNNSENTRDEAQIAEDIGIGEPEKLTAVDKLDRSPSTHLLYVGDGPLEYQNNYRLRAMGQLMNDLRPHAAAPYPYHTVHHEFQYAKQSKYKKSYLQPCGHPWAALIVFDALLVARIHKLNHIALGFEVSANEGNDVFSSDGIEVNHQYDKSSEFVALTRGYVKELENMGNDLCGTVVPGGSAQSTGVPGGSAQKSYVILNTPLANRSELEIARLLCSEKRLKPFLPHFISCNEITEDYQWCSKCAKCAFVTLLLSAWLPPPAQVSNDASAGCDAMHDVATIDDSSLQAEMPTAEGVLKMTSIVMDIFNGHNLLDDPDMCDIYISLIATRSNFPGSGIEDVSSEVYDGNSPPGVHKPWDCVGTVSECREAVRLITEQYSTKTPMMPLPYNIAKMITYLDGV